MGEILEWTVAHRREARSRLYQIAAEMMLAGVPETGGRRRRWKPGKNPNALIGLYHRCESEREFRSAMEWDTKFKPARIDREVRRVDALATGRLVRETVWQARHVGGTSPLAECDTRAALGEWVGRGYIAAKPRIVRVARIRRAPR